MEIPTVRYTRTTDGVNIAYWMAGSGPALLWGMPVLVSHVELIWRVPGYAEMFERLMEEHTVVAWDVRNHGLSDRGIAEVTAEDVLHDLTAVVSRCQAPVAIAGNQHHAQPMVRLAVDRPELVDQLIMITPWLGDGAPDEFLGPATLSLASMATLDWQMFARSWANAAVGADDPLMVGPLAELMTCASDPGSIHPRPGSKGVWDGDFKEYLPQVRQPCLVLHPRKYPWLEQSQLAAKSIPNARLAVLDLPTMVATGREVADRICHFLAENRRAAANSSSADASQGFRTILFSDVVSSTPLLTQLRDSGMREVMRVHDEVLQSAVSSHGGRVIKTMGDAFMAEFTVPSAAIEAAISAQRGIRDRFAGSDIPLRIRIGINAGEPMEENGDLYGVAVVIAKRLESLAEDDGILVSDVVRASVAGKEFVFEDRGLLALKGIEEPIRAWQVRWLD